MDLNRQSTSTDTTSTTQIGSRSTLSTFQRDSSQDPPPGGYQGPGSGSQEPLPSFWNQGTWDLRLPTPTDASASQIAQLGHEYQQLFPEGLQLHWPNALHRSQPAFVNWKAHG